MHSLLQEGSGQSRLYSEGEQGFDCFIWCRCMLAVNRSLAEQAEPFSKGDVIPI